MEKRALPFVEMENGPNPGYHVSSVGPPTGGRDMERAWPSQAPMGVIKNMFLKTKTNKSLGEARTGKLSPGDSMASELTMQGSALLRDEHQP